jgi:hypothetical protein
MYYLRDVILQTSVDATPELLAVCCGTGGLWRTSSIS